MDQTIKMEGLSNVRKTLNSLASRLSAPIGMDTWVLLALLLAFLATGCLFGGYIGYHQCERDLQDSVTMIRMEAIEEYKDALEEARASESAERTLQMKDEGAKRKEEIMCIAKLLEGVREFHFDVADLITYGICVYNRILHPEFPDSFDGVIHQGGRQWINYSDDTVVVNDYYKIAERIVDLCYNETARPCSYKYAWIEIIDGQLFLKDAYEIGPNTHYWRYSE